MGPNRGTGYLRGSTRRRKTQDELIAEQEARNQLALGLPPGHMLERLGQTVNPAMRATSRSPVVQLRQPPLSPTGRPLLGMAPPPTFPPLEQGNIPEPTPYPGITPPEMPEPPQLDPASFSRLGARPTGQPALRQEPVGALEAQETSQPGLFDRMFGQAEDGGGSPMSLALLSAGLGILANNYGHYGQAGPAIGKGAMQGLQTYMSERDRISQRKSQEQKMGAEAAQQAAYLRQVTAQEQKANREDQADTRKQALQRLIFETPQGPQRDKLIEQLQIESGQYPQYLKASQAPAGPKPSYQTIGVGKDEKGNDLEQRALLNPDGSVASLIGTPVRKGSGQTINVQGKAAEITAAATAKGVEELRQEAAIAREGATNFRLIADLLEDYEGGAFDDMLAAAGKFLPQEDLREIRTAKELSESIRLRAANAFKMPGAVSNYEAQTYLAAVPGLVTYREGREVAARLADKLATRKAKLVSFQQTQLRTQGWVDEEALDDYAKSLGPIFTDEERRVLKTAGKRKESGGAPVRQRSPQGVAPAGPATPGPIAPPGTYYTE